MLSVISTLLWSVLGCAYQLGNVDRSLPGGYRHIAVPMFKNASPEPGVEVYFTNALIQEMNRSQVARVVNPEWAEVRVEGFIENVSYTPSGTKPEDTLPTGAVLATVYTIRLGVRLVLRRQADQSILWEGSFAGERDYKAPEITTAGVNTANPLYNLSSRRQNIEAMAAEMMNEAYGRITENF